ncbi:disease resistance protein Roq1-like [Apium graveolens]|uniref:disease resistance protein Roq1-like n=1 Tax=Apium graveolens TaxID=4045 RepID=UPI003D7A8271
MTTRCADLIQQLQEDISETDMYMMKELRQKESWELFSYHAFRKSLPPVSFLELSVSLVDYVGGHPLALKALGSSLRENNIKKILQLSYDELDDEKKKLIFLNIVFFFVEKDKDETAHIFKSCDYCPDAGIPVLVERFLLRIDEDNKFQMHNLIQDMGREVIREEYKHGKCLHLHLCRGNALEAFQNLEGTDKIEGLVDLTPGTQRHVSAKNFERLPNLRLLEIISPHDIGGNFERSFHELRFIRWRHCPWTHLPSSFCPQKLVSLDMTFSKLKTLWKGTMQPSVSLNTITVSYSKNLKTTPNFRDSKLVEKLLFRGCRNLLRVHPSIEQLSQLCHLDLNECGHLRELPETVA